MLIQEITLQGILSFGPETPPLEMRPLNVLIGANGSGKSNLIEAIGVLRSAPKNLAEPVRRGGGVEEWIWKGFQRGEDASAIIDAKVLSKDHNIPLLRHAIRFTESGFRFRLTKEQIENCGIEPDFSQQALIHKYNGAADELTRDGTITPFHRGNHKYEMSILSILKDPIHYPELTGLSEAYGDIRIYRDWLFGRSSGQRSDFRKPQQSDMPSDRLEEDFSNLALFLSQLRRVPAAKKAVLSRLHDIYDGLDDFDVHAKGGMVEVFLTEGNFTIPASRLSDGTLRYLCLLAILCDPDPPRLICIEEPELGLHPDLLPTLARLLVETSKRTQLIVTTHSDILVDAMSETPESVVVFEKHDGKTEMKRLTNDEELQDMLNDYRLGQLWLQGQIGGTRW